MVRYGGPRFEFYFTHQFLNNEQTIRKEDAQRVASILRRRRPPPAASAPPPVAPPAVVAAPEKDDPPPAPPRLAALAAPTLRGAPVVGVGAAGRVLRPLPTAIPLPLGRGGVAYTPGVDRHRIVPRCRCIEAPWFGSGTKRAEQDEAEREERRFLFGGPRPSRADAAARTHRINGMTRQHNAAMARANATRTKATKRTPTPTPPEAEDERERRDEALEVESNDAPSVFSHASSNAPIRALGTQHMETSATKEEVQRHLKQYGGKMTAPRPDVRPPTPFDDMTLQEVTVRLVRMQKRLQS